MKTTALLGLVLLAALTVQAAPESIQFSHVEEWHMWKSQHEKSYSSMREELDRHIVWLANREYINVHNQNAHVLGFTLAMNHFGDMVSF